MNRVGILVGHYGKGTGASYDYRDEWTICNEIAQAVIFRLDEVGKVWPYLISVDCEAEPWDTIQLISKSSPPSFLGGWGNIDYRVEVAKKKNLDAAIELHLNGFIGNATGFEIFITRNARQTSFDLAQRLLGEFVRNLGGRNRGIKTKSFRVLRKLDPVCPVVLVEPAFLAQRELDSGDWRERLVESLITGIYRQFNVTP